MAGSCGVPALATSPSGGEISVFTFTERSDPQPTDAVAGSWQGHSSRASG